MDLYDIVVIPVSISDFERSKIFLTGQNQYNYYYKTNVFADLCVLRSCGRLKFISSSLLWVG